MNEQQKADEVIQQRIRYNPNQEEKANGSPAPEADYTSETSLCVTVGDGKYTVRQDETGRLTALRYGEPWRDCCGDSLIYTLAAELAQAIKDRDALKECCELRLTKLNEAIKERDEAREDEKVSIKLMHLNRKDREKAEQQLATLREALGSIRQRLGDFQEPWSPREK
ncbi:MAG TPA: hypothetical protein V6D20_11130, partial [Candidatus Obscuribacterales bacterium]